METGTVTLIVLQRGIREEGTGTRRVDRIGSETSSLQEVKTERGSCSSDGKLSLQSRPLAVNSAYRLQSESSSDTLALAAVSIVLVLGSNRIQLASKQDPTCKSDSFSVGRWIFTP